MAGQECLALVEQQRIAGGLLGPGHSWVGPSGGADAGDAAGPSSEAPPPPATSTQQQQQRPSRMAQLQHALYHRREDLRDLLAREVRVSTSWRVLLLAQLAVLGVVALAVAATRR